MTMKKKVPENGGLEGIEDNNGGIYVEMTQPMNSITFLTMLRASITQWKEQKKKSVWIKLPIELVNLVEPAVKEGFHYHHAETRYIMLVYWIPDTTPKLPANASHRVGIGAFIMNNNGEVLVVQENKGKFRGTGIWKLPTGVVNEGEDIPAAAIREVKEETGIESEFLEVLAFRQSHNSFFSKSDLFFVCLLRPLSFTIQQQNSEVEAAQWMAVEEYAAQPFVQKKEIFHQIAKICLAKISNKYTVISDDGPANGNYNDAMSLPPPVATGGDGGKYSDGTSPTTGGCGNCSICPYTCHTPPPPPTPTPPSSSGYPSYGTPPSPPTGQASNCPPAVPVQCCQYNSPPTPFYTPYYNGTSSSAAAAAEQNIAISTWCLAVFYVVVSVIFSLDLLQF